MTLIVTVKDIDPKQDCSKGVRKFFADHNLDYTDFILNGIDADILLAIDDIMAHKIVEVARGRSK